METKQALVIKSAAYCRISTLLLGQDINNQLVPIRQFAKARGFTMVKEYCDEGVSGAKERRPQLDQLIHDARSGQFKVLIVAALDRVGRNVKHLLTLIDELNALGVKFISLRENIDLSTPQGQMTLTVLAACAQLEREITRQRIREALAAKKLVAAQTGSNWRSGRPTVVTPEIAAQVIELRSLGLSIRKIEQALHKKISRASIERILKATATKPSGSSSQK